MDAGLPNSNQDDKKRPHPVGEDGHLEISATTHRKRRRGQRSPERPPPGGGEDDEDARRDEEEAEDEKPAFSARVVKGQVVDSETMYQPDPKMVAALVSGKFVPLWHFIDRNCKNAAMRQVITGNDGLTLKVDGKSLNVSGDAFPTSTKGILKDDQISYNNFHHAQPLLIAKMYES